MNADYVGDRHGDLVQQVLTAYQITVAQVDEGDAAVAKCLEKAGKVQQILGEVHHEMVNIDQSILGEGWSVSQRVDMLLQSPLRPEQADGVAAVPREREHVVSPNQGGTWMNAAMLWNGSHDSLPSVAPGTITAALPTGITTATTITTPPQPTDNATSATTAIRGEITTSPQPLQTSASPQPFQTGASPQPLQTGASPQPLPTGASPQPLPTTTSPTTPQGSQCDHTGTLVSTGLKHFALRLCEKIEKKKKTTYNEISDELLADLRMEQEAGLLSGGVEEKNLRRRVYDALNVLDALGVVMKDKRDIEWIGWAARSRREKQRMALQAERTQLVDRVNQKLKNTYKTSIKAYCLSNLILRNKDAPLPVLLAAQQQGLAAPTPLPLPFMMIHAPPEAKTDLHISDDCKQATMNFHDSFFQVFDDEGVMRLMGLGEPCPGLMGLSTPQMHSS